MGLAVVDPALLVPVAGQVPAEGLVDDLAGEPAALRIEGDWSQLSYDDAAVVHAFLRRVPVLTVAVGPAVAAADLWAPDADTADRWLERFERTAAPLVAAALLLRQPVGSVAAGLVAESTTYSMLQAGPDFARWRAGAVRRGPATDRDAPRVRVEKRGNVCEVVLTRPGRHNALDAAMRDALHAALTPFRHTQTTVIVRGEGPSFCAGGDLGEFGAFADPVSAHLVRLGRSLAQLFADLGPRLIVGLHGACLGAGIELPAFAGRVVAADDAAIGLPEATLGLIPGAGGTVSIPRRTSASRVLELLLDDPIDAKTALSWGLVDEVVPRDHLQARLLELAG
jgi:enoyl-CoA hydratase/carnithine racemase